DLDQRLPLGIDDAEHRASWVGSGSRVITAVARVEPDFVGSPDSCHPRIDFTRPRVDDDLRGSSDGSRIRRLPRLPVSVKDHAATDEKILVRTEGESGRLAPVDQELPFHRASTTRVDSYNRSGGESAAATGVTVGAVNFRNGNIELAITRIKRWLFSAV